MKTQTSIRKWNYGHYSSSNYGANSMAVSIGGLTLWFSYDTVIAIQAPGHLKQVCENGWGNTTGKHLNWLEPNKKERLSFDEFNNILRRTLVKHDLEI